MIKEYLHNNNFIIKTNEGFVNTVGNKILFFLFNKAVNNIRRYYW